MKTKKIISQGPKKTEDIGKKLAEFLKKGDIVCLFGDLGSGKTTFTKGIAQGLGLDTNSVNSPTFVLMNIYQGSVPLYHFDFYRLESLKEIEEIGYEDYFYGDGIAVIEWADRLKILLPDEFLKVEFRFKNEKEREIIFKPQGKRAQELMAGLLL